jgi:undecaprenyl-diphosphatase
MSGPLETFEEGAVPMGAVGHARKPAAGLHAAAAAQRRARGVPAFGGEIGRTAATDRPGWECNVRRPRGMEPSPPPAPGERRREPRGGFIGGAMDALYGLLRWIDRHARGFYAEVGLYLAIGFGLSFAALAGFLLLSRVTAGSGIEQVDVAVLRWLRDHQAPPLDALALAGTALGSGIAAYLVLAVAALLFWRSRHHLSALLLVATLVGARAMIGLLKTFYERPRPGLFGDEVRALGLTFPYPESASFPSGHAITAVAVFGTLAYLVARLEPTRRVRRLTLAGALSLIVLIGFSRVYFAVHYPSDVVAGFLAGILWATFCAFGLEVGTYMLGRRRAGVPLEQGLESGMRPVRESLRTGG